LRLAGGRVREGRERLALSIEDASTKASVSPHTWVRAEHGDEIRPSSARRIAEALGVEPAQLMEEPTPPLGGTPSRSQSAETDEAGHDLPAWASTPDMDVFRLRASETPTNALLWLAIQLVGGPRRIEDVRGKDPTPSDQERPVNFARALIVREELIRRGEKPPENFVLALRRSMDRLGLLEEPGSDALRHEQPGTREAGGAASREVG
jgi:transcriptional regulator with XRE-family HTH domain